MKANTVFVHRHLPHAVVKGDAAAYFRISTGRRGDLGLDDEMTGDLGTNRGKWCFNITRSTLIHVRVLSQHSSLRAAVLATTTDRAVQAPDA